MSTYRTGMGMRIQLRRGTYEELTKANLVYLDGELIIVTKLPWFKSWFGLKPTRFKIGDGKTPFQKLRFI